MNKDASLTEEERFPLLTEGGRQLLHWMWEHPQAPRFNFPCGDRITLEGLERLRAYETELHSAKPGWAEGEQPGWLKHFVETCLQDVPFYRRRGGSAIDFYSLPTCQRSDLDREPWSFVPDSQPLDDLIVYTTSGTTGQPLRVLSHPVVASKYLPALRFALSKFGVTLEGGEGNVSIVTVCAQANTYTYATVSSFLEGAGYLKVNLNPNEWHDPNDRVPFLDDCNPEIYTGDPLAFVALSQLPLKTQPKALVSSAMTLLPGLQKELEDHFHCPVIDIYSMNESRLIAVRVEQSYHLIPHDLFIEILDPEGLPCAPGVRGEIVLTGGRNPFLPLLRYRTGDYAALEYVDQSPLLTNFEGRPPIFFLSNEGKIICSLDVSKAFQHLAIAQFSLHQNPDLSLLFSSYISDLLQRQVSDALQSVFGHGIRITFQQLSPTIEKGNKVIQYTSDIEPTNISQVEINYLSTSTS